MYHSIHESPREIYFKLHSVWRITLPGESGALCRTLSQSKMHVQWSRPRHGRAGSQLWKLLMLLRAEGAWQTQGSAPLRCVADPNLTNMTGSQGVTTWTLHGKTVIPKATFEAMNTTIRTNKRSYKDNTWIFRDSATVHKRVRSKLF